jgi:hypothetical protein
MYAMFVSDGPFSGKAKQRRRLRTRSTSNLFSRLITRSHDRDEWHATGETYVMQGFQNVEVYGLVTKLLDIEAYAVKTNGTSGFWNQYL